MAKTSGNATLRAARDPSRSMSFSVTVLPRTMADTRIGLRRFLILSLKVGRVMVSATSCSTPDFCVELLVAVEAFEAIAWFARFAPFV